MTEKVYKAIADGTLNIGGASIKCAVLDDGNETRVLSERGTSLAMGIKRGGAHWRRRKESIGANSLPVYISAPNLEPFISNELRHQLSNLYRYTSPKGGAIANGLSGIVFPKICEVWADAYKAGALLESQEHIGIQAVLLGQGLDEVAIVSLIDEATGYQKLRSDNELQRILSAYVLPEHRPYISAVPKEFNQEIHRVWGWDYPENNRGPRYVGKLIRQLIYQQMPTPILPKLDEVNPPDKNWQRKHKHHSHLTPKIGLSHFRTQMAGVMALLRATPSNNRQFFWRLFERAYGKQMRLALGDDEGEAKR